MKNMSPKAKVILAVVTAFVGIVIISGIFGDDNAAPSSTGKVQVPVVNATSEDMPWFEVSESGEICLSAEYRPSGITFAKEYISDNGYYNNGSKYDELPEELIIPDTFNSVAVLSIRYYAFSKCERIKSVVIGNNVLTIGECAFNENLLSVAFGASITTIETGAFGCSKISEIVLPNTVAYIGEDAFAFCNIKEITIPGSVMSIGSRAFFGCDKLKSVTIGEPGNCKLYFIDNAAFRKCSIEKIAVYTAESNVNIGGRWYDDSTKVEWKK